jgi:hypothetical protein
MEEAPEKNVCEREGRETELRNHNIFLTILLMSFIIKNYYMVSICANCANRFKHGVQISMMITSPLLVYITSIT